MGERTARVLASGRPLTLAEVRYVANYFPRHAGDRIRDEGTPGALAWAAWGGDAMRAWADGVLRREGVGASAARPASMGGVRDNPTAARARDLGARLGVRWDRAPFAPADLARGMRVELEHRDVTHGALEPTARIALAHLRERPDYYAALAKMERDNPEAPRRYKCGAVPAHERSEAARILARQRWCQKSDPARELAEFLSDAPEARAVRGSAEAAPPAGKLRKDSPQGLASLADGYSRGECVVPYPAGAEFPHRPGTSRGDPEHPAWAGYAEALRDARECADERVAIVAVAEGRDPTPAEEECATVACLREHPRFPQWDATAREIAKAYAGRVEAKRLKLGSESFHRERMQARVRAVAEGVDVTDAEYRDTLSAATRARSAPRDPNVAAAKAMQRRR